MTQADKLSPPSSWVTRFAHRIPKGGKVLDVACGRGRHTRFFLERGHPVVAIDRDIERLGELRQHPKIEALAIDLESGEPWPFPASRFAGIIVTNYLYRPLFPSLVESLSENGVLIYETFAKGNERFGHPKNPDYLLEEGELLRRLVGELYVVSYEQCEQNEPEPAVLQRIAAIRKPNPWH
ncbi:MAG: class I SAM-dependent methyltransferase [Alphaproteobacteria bacterium]